LPARHYNEPLSEHFGSPWNASMTSKILIVVFLIAIVWNLGAGMYYMMTDKGDSDRTLKALVRRIALSVLLIVLIIIGMLTGYIQPHGIQ
jgi:succinate dehydrogenase/fumarate reductase cytochrome b subunit